MRACVRACVCACACVYACAYACAFMCTHVCVLILLSLAYQERTREFLSPFVPLALVHLLSPPPLARFPSQLFLSPSPFTPLSLRHPPILPPFPSSLSSQMVPHSVELLTPLTDFVSLVRSDGDFKDDKLDTIVFKHIRYTCTDTHWHRRERERARARERESKNGTDKQQ